MNKKKKLELLAPAKDLACGLAAINHGADAVYIGAPKFGAREAAGNSIDDIKALVRHAHLYGAKVFVTLNTILYDVELDDAREMIESIYQAGADALIIQDMGILEMDLPPIPLHASTQTHNFDLEKIKFLEQVGFERVILARESTIEQIRTFSSETNVELEAFIHGALCVSLSGQCYLSQAIGGRSANRGACAQPCRKKYTLVDAEGITILHNKHLLSLKDLNLTDAIGEMAEAGICSFKIEGRLKDENYVKNITAHYRKAIDSFLETHPDYCRASAGKVTFGFEPTPAKSFNRGNSDYFLHGRHAGITAFDTPKSLGEYAGKVSRVSERYFEIDGPLTIANNDGLVFVNRAGESVGLKVNSVDGKRIFPDRMNRLPKGVKIYRNFDHEFRKTLKIDSTTRKIDVVISMKETTDGFELSATDETGCMAYFVVSDEKQPARNAERAAQMIKQQFSKAGDTAFRVTKIETNGADQFFFPAGKLNTMRRELLNQLTEKRQTKPAREIFISKNEVPYPEKELHFETNISNQLAKKFYERHGAIIKEEAFEKLGKVSGRKVMTTRHCLKYEAGFCNRFPKGEKRGEAPAEPWFLEDGNMRLQVRFDCSNCQMKLYFE